MGRAKDNRKSVTLAKAENPSKCLILLLSRASEKWANSIAYVKIGTQWLSTKLSMVRSSERPSTSSLDAHYFRMFGRKTRQFPPRKRFHLQQAEDEFVFSSVNTATISKRCMDG